MLRLSLVFAISIFVAGYRTHAAAQSYGRNYYNLQGYSKYSNPGQNAIFNSPTVSPYLNLLRPQGGVAIPNYQALVRPQLQQQQINQQQGRQLQQLQRRTYQGPSSQSSAGAPIAIRSTGHTTGFMNYSAYYPQLQGSTGPAQPRAAPGGGGR